MTLALNLLMPVMLAGISLYAMCKRVDVYDGVIHGAAEGLSVIYRIAPPLIALMTAIAMLRASGALELAAQALSPVLGPGGEAPPKDLIQQLRGQAGAVVPHGDSGVLPRRPEGQGNLPVLRGKADGVEHQILQGAAQLIRVRPDGT